jgi:integrase
MSRTTGDERTSSRAATNRDRRVAEVRASLPTDCPLRVHANGQWVKKIHGRRVSFGSILEVQLDEAIRAYRIYIGDIAAERAPKPPRAAAAVLRVHQVLDGFAAHQMRRAMAGEISAKSAERIRPFLAVAGRSLGPGRSISSLTSGDFQDLRLALLEAFPSPATVGGAIVAIKAAFRHAVERDPDATLPPWGREFRPPARRDVRRHRRAEGTDAGQLFLEHDEIRLLVDRAKNPMLRAAILLGINGALGPQECADLRRDEVSLEDQLVMTVREKTLVDRVVWLWPETADAIRVWLDAAERIPRAADAQDLLLCTRQGRPIARRVAIRDSAKGKKTFKAQTSAVGLAFRRLLDDTGLKRRRIGFYTLRHTFAAIASGAGDPRTVKVVMGHATDMDITESYVDEGFVDSIRHVCSHVRSWYLGERSTALRLSAFRRRPS